MSNIVRVEKVCGDLDDHYAKDRMANLIEALQYSRDDQRRNRPNLSEIPINGDIYNNLATYRSAAELYKRFRDETEDGGLETPDSKAGGNAASLEEVPGQRMGLERDLQDALRSEIEPLEPGLRIIDGGTERSVDSGAHRHHSAGLLRHDRRHRIEIWSCWTKSCSADLELYGRCERRGRRRARNPRGLRVRCEGKGRGQNGALPYSQGIRRSV